MDATGSDFTLLVVKVSYDHAACIRPALPRALTGNVSAERVTFILDSSMGNVTELACWRSNYESEPPIMFQQQTNVNVVDGRFSLDIALGDYYTVSTIQTAQHGGFPSSPVPASQPRFPLPLHDDFDSATVSQQPKYWSNEQGVFEVHVDAGNSSNRVLRQMVPQPPLHKPGRPNAVTSQPNANTVVGMLEWEDISIVARFRLLVAGASVSRTISLPSGLHSLYLGCILLKTASDIVVGRHASLHAWTGSSRLDRFSASTAVAAGPSLTARQRWAAIYQLPLGYSRRRRR